MTDDHTLARTLATDAGALLLELRAGAGPDADRKSLRAAGDAARTSCSWPRSPGTGRTTWCCPRRARTPPRPSADRAWIIHPLDGTREFGEAGRSDWAVHVALWERGELAAGAVALPGLDVTYATDDPRARPAVSGRPGRWSAGPGRRTSPCGWPSWWSPSWSRSARPGRGVAVIRGDADAYAHAGGRDEWDSAARRGRVAAGLHASRVDGSPLE